MKKFFRNAPWSFYGAWALSIVVVIAALMDMSVPRELYSSTWMVVGWWFVVILLPITATLATLAMMWMEANSDEQ